MVQWITHFTSHRGNKIPLKKAAGLNNALFKAWKRQREG